MGRNDHLDDLDEEDDVPLPDEYDLIDLGEWGDWAGEVANVRELMKDESVRGACILARAYLEDALDVALLVTATLDPTQRREIVKIASGDFPKKIQGWVNLADLPAHIGEIMMSLKKVGDAFAHRPHARTFDHPEIAKLMAKLTEAVKSEHSESGPPPAMGVMTIELALHEALANIVTRSAMLRARGLKP